MGNHNALFKEQLLHMLFGSAIFVVLGSIAVAPDLAAAAVEHMGVSVFTHRAVELAAHAMLAVDLVLFGLYLAKSSWLLLKETFQ